PNRATAPVRENGRTERCRRYSASNRTDRTHQRPACSARSSRTWSPQTQAAWQEADAKAVARRGGRSTQCDTDWERSSSAPSSWRSRRRAARPTLARPPTPVRRTTPVLRDLGRGEVPGNSACRAAMLAGDLKELLLTFTTCPDEDCKAFASVADRFVLEST